MARYADDELSDLKQNVSLLRLIESQGYELKREGKDYVMCCPFHEEDTASMKITPSNNLFHCFGCGAGGSVIDWVMKTQGVSFRHAVEILRTDTSLAAEPLKTKTSTVRKLASPLSEDADKQTALTQVIAYYHDTLKQSPEALEYLKARGLDDTELIDHFKLGFANRSLGLHLPQKNRKAGAKLRGLLQEIGIYRDSGHEHFNGSLVVPIINDRKITEVYGRKLGSRLRKGTPLHLYLPDAHEGVFNVEHINGDEVILCESIIDALTFWRWGFKHVTTSYGTSGFTNEVLQALIDNKVKRVLIAYDRDDSGNAAAEKVAKKLNKENIDAYRILFPKGMDANEYALKMTPAQKSLALAIRKAEPMGKIVHSVVNPLAAKEAEQTLDLSASPVPVAPAIEIPMEVTESEIMLTLGDRSYRVKGFNADLVSDALKVNLMVMKNDMMHMDKLDLYVSKQRQVFINQASVELGVEPDVIKKDLGKVLLQLESLQQSTEANEPEKIDTITNAEREAALDLLTDDSLLSRILIDFDNAGVVGEESNKLVGYLACVSRLLAKPLAVMVQSSSAAGKSSLMDAVLNLMPENERVQYSAMTGQSLFYMGETNLKNKILAISEEEGAHNASYALKLLQSEGEVTIASTGKDDSTGDLITKEYRVEGPVMLFMTTTAIDIDEELLNRCLVLSVNESRAQTRAIHEAQRKSRTLEGLQNKLRKAELTQLHRHAQQLLRPLAVINPYADQLTFLDDKTRTRRDHEKYLTLIDSIALLHQYQREIKTIESNGETIEYIEVTLSDIEVANRLAHEILGRTLDELPPQTRKLLTKIQTMVRDQCKAQGIEQSDYRFSRKDIRDFTGWSDGQLKIHCTRLSELEYVLIHRGGRGCSLVYELLYTCDVGSNDSQLMGLINTEQLKKEAYDAQKSGVKEETLAPSQGQVRPKSDPMESIKLNGHAGLPQSGRANDKNASLVI
ncbi:MAG: CHC2 zinc finger domain-containing protein [Puniceicoccaceae bacterium]|nr:CHC2 zinc finger domain-containing protein [Puniceicoccaceae bacterium]